MARLKIRKRTPIGEWSDAAKAAALEIDPEIDFEAITHYAFCQQRSEAALKPLHENMAWVASRILGDHGPLKEPETTEHSPDETEAQTPE